MERLGVAIEKRHVSPFGCEKFGCLEPNAGRGARDQDASPQQLLAPHRPPPAFDQVRNQDAGERMCRSEPRLRAATSISSRTSSVCCPNRGGNLRTVAGVAEKYVGIAMATN